VSAVLSLTIPGRRKKKSNRKTKLWEVMKPLPRVAIPHPLMKKTWMAVR
jgi:hypothetical protein